jgi:hypothetical protein
MFEWLHAMVVYKGRMRVLQKGGGRGRGDKDFTINFLQGCHTVNLTKVESSSLTNNFLRVRVNQRIRFP